MSYVVLARKYRPRRFSELVGQETVTGVLRGAIAEGRIGHAYLLTGPRGTGKTTSARLFAKALNCERGPAPEPCGECERCRSLDAGGEVDVLEIDAASNTGVDHVRELRDQASYVPLRARFKVYIVDEVHMLSKAAFNALLKTLEEPPPHVKFLFATTELHKVPDTILSRCQVLRLGPLSDETIAKRLAEIFSAEGIEAEAGVAEDLARRARGGMRDALSLADQLLALVGSRPALADCERLSGEGSAKGIAELVELLIAGDRVGVLNALPAAEGGEGELLSGLLDHLRGCLIAALCGAGAPVLPAGVGDAATLAERGRRIGPRRLELWLQELLAARERMRLVPSHGRLVLEVALLDLCRGEGTVELDEIVRRLADLEGRVQGATAPAARAAAPAAAAPAARAAAPAAAAPARGPAAPRDRRPEPAAAPSSSPGPRVRTNSAADAWEGFLSELESDSASLHSVIARRGRLEQYRGGRAAVKLTGMNEEERVLLSDRRNRRTCSRAFTRAVGREVEVDFEDAARARPGAEDPFTREVADLFEGRIEE